MSLLLLRKLRIKVGFTIFSDNKEVVKHYTHRFCKPLCMLTPSIEHCGVTKANCKCFAYVSSRDVWHFLARNILANYFAIATCLS